VAIKKVTLKDGRPLDVDSNTLSQAKRIAKASGVGTSEVLLKMMGNMPKELSGGEVAKNVVSDIGTNVAGAAQAIPGGVANFARGQLKNVLSGETLPTPLGMPLIPQGDFSPLLRGQLPENVSMQSPLSLGRQALSRAAGTQDVIGDTIGGLGMQIDESNRQFEETNPSGLARAARLSPEIAALIALRDKTSVGKLTKTHPEIFRGLGIGKSKNILDATKGFERAGIINKSGTFGAIAGGNRPRGEGEGLAGNTLAGEAMGVVGGTAMKGIGGGLKLGGSVFSQKIRDKFLADRLVGEAGIKGAGSAAKVKANQELFKAVGIKNPPISSVLGNSDAVVAEEAAKQLGAEAAKKAQFETTGQIIKVFRNFVDRINPQKTSPERITSLVFKTIKKSVDHMDQARKSIFRKGLEVAKRATGDQKVIPTKNLVAAIKGKVSEIKNNVHGSQARADIKELNAFLKDIRQNMSISELQGSLSSIGKDAAGKGSPLSDIKSMASRRASSFIFGELNKVLETAMKGNRAIGTFHQARQAYSRMSDKMDHFHNTLIGRVVDSRLGFRAGIFSKTLLRASDDEIAIVMPMLRAHDKEAAGAITRHLWNSIVDKSMSPKSRVQGTHAVDLDKFTEKVLSKEFAGKVKAALTKEQAKEAIPFARALKKLVNRAKGSNEFVSQVRDASGLAGNISPQIKGFNQGIVFLFTSLIFLGMGLMIESTRKTNKQ